MAFGPDGEFVCHLATGKSDFTIREFGADLCARGAHDRIRRAARGDVRPGATGVATGVVRPGAPPGIGRPLIAGVYVRSVVCRRSLSLGGRPAPNFLDLFFQPREADSVAAFCKLPRILHLARREAAVGVPIELRAVALGAALEESDPVFQHGGVRGACPPFSCRCREKRQGSAEQVGLRDRMLEYQPGRFRPVTTDQIRTRPSDRLDDSPETPGIALVHPSHPRFIARVEERAGGCKFGPHGVIQPGHVQEVAAQRPGAGSTRFSLSDLPVTAPAGLEPALPLVIVSSQCWCSSLAPSPGTRQRSPAPVPLTNF